MNYWLKGQIKHITDNEYNTSNFYLILKSKYPNNLYKIDTCENEIKDINVILFQNIQKLYNLYDNLNQYISNSIYDDKRHCVNANKCVELYESLVIQCNPKIDSAICGELKNFKNHYNEQMRSDSICTEVKKILSYPEINEVLEEGQRERESQVSSYEQEVSVDLNLGGTTSSGLSPTAFNVIVFVVVSLVVSKILFILYKVNINFI